MFSTRFVCARREYSTLTEMVPAPCLRRSFMLDTVTAQAKLTVCGLGYYELFVNGTRITRGLLSPYISNPDDLLYYDEYDLTAYLTKGENVIGVMLGNGMLNCPGGDIWDLQLVRYRSSPKVALSFESDALSFEADDTFVCADSPIYYEDERVGEFYDARREMPGWAAPGFDASAWTPALPAETPRGECRLCTAAPIVTTKTLSPVEIRRGGIGKEPHLRETLPVNDPVGVEAETRGWLYDFGVNTAGLCRLSVQGKPGQKIVIQYGEILDENGDLDMRAMSFLPNALNHRDIYICKGEGTESWQPMFTYHAFRYALVLGITDEQATKDLLTYDVMNTDLHTRGTFESDSGMLNAIQQATLVADLANFYHFPTDCPHREKNGWTADAALSTEQMLLNFDPEVNYAEWLVNIRKAQREDGALPGIVPTGGWGFDWGNGPAWDCVLVYLPYFIWKYRGETQVIRDNAAAIMRYLHYITTRRDEDGLIHIGLGDWCHAGRSNPKAPLKLTDTLMCMDISRKAETIFRATGMELQADFARSVHISFRAAARKHLVDTRTMTAYGRCQCSQSMAIFYDLFDEAEKPEALRVLVDMIHKNGDLLNVGVLGARVMFRVLAEGGYADLACRMILGPEYPSYGYWIEQGATSLWEGFWPKGEQPLSCNHHFWGDVSGWMYAYPGGLRVNPNDESPDRIDIAPCFVSQLGHVRAAHTLPAGEAECEWAREADGSVTLRTVVPQSCRGDVYAPRGWQFADGECVKPLTSGSRVYRLIPDTQKDEEFR